MIQAARARAHGDDGHHDVDRVVSKHGITHKSQGRKSGLDIVLASPKISQALVKTVLKIFSEKNVADKLNDFFEFEVQRPK